MVLNDGTSQGYLRLRVLNNSLYIPDGDPNGYAPSYVYVSANGDTFTQTVVQGAVHTYDVIARNGLLLCSNGMLNGQSALCGTSNNGSTPWTTVSTAAYSRYKFMVEHNGALYAAKRMIGSAVDYARWTGDVTTEPAQGVNALPGEANTFRWYVTGSNRLFWSVFYQGTLHVHYTDNGQTWTEATSLQAQFVSDFAELSGNLYALTDKGLWGALDGANFVQVAPPPTASTFGMVPSAGSSNADATASMELYQGALWCGSSTNGRIYRIE